MATTTVGVLAAHDEARHLAGHLTRELSVALRERFSHGDWRVEHAETDPADPAADERELVEALRRRSLDEGWQLAIGLTDLPLSVRRHPVRAHVSTQHGVGLVSIPALGPVRRELRLRETALSVIERLTGGRENGAEPRANAIDDETARTASTLELTGSVLRQHMRLLLGMVRANQPSRAAASMSHAALGALGTAAFSLTSQNVWQLADSMGMPRLLALSFISVVITTAAMLMAHGLWERTKAPAVRERVILFNLSTSLTLILATTALYAALFAISLASAGVLIAPSAFEQALSHPVGVWDYVRLSWLAASIATVGGALGSLIDSDKAVRNAVYHPRPAHEAHR
jgi:uncharacterized membrane protein